MRVYPDATRDLHTGPSCGPGTGLLGSSPSSLCCGFNGMQETGPLAESPDRRAPEEPGAQLEASQEADAGKPFLRSRNKCAAPLW